MVLYFLILIFLTLNLIHYCITIIIAFDFYGIFILCLKRFSGYRIYLGSLGIHILLKIVNILTRKGQLNRLFIFFVINVSKCFFRQGRFKREIFTSSFILHQVLTKLWRYLYLHRTFEIKRLFASLCIHLVLICWWC